MSGETAHWHRLAAQQARSVDECMESNSSTQFLDWNAYFDIWEWEFMSPDRAQAALVASEVRALRITLKTLFGGKEDLPPFKDFVLRKEMPEPPPSPTSLEEAEFDAPQDGGIEIGEPLDEKWQKVNEQVNNEFAMMAVMFGGAATYKPAGG